MLGFYMSLFEFESAACSKKKHVKTEHHNKNLFCQSTKIEEFVGYCQKKVTDTLKESRVRRVFFKM